MKIPETEFIRHLQVASDSVFLSSTVELAPLQSHTSSDATLFHGELGEFLLAFIFRPLLRAFGFPHVAFQTKKDSDGRTFQLS